MKIKKRLIKESGGNVSETVEHIEEYLDKLMAIGKNKGVFQDKPLGEKINKLGHKMLVNINKFAHAIENYHPHHDNHDHDHDHEHDKHGHGGQSFVDRRKNPPPRPSAGTIRENKRVIKEGGENIKGIVDHIGDELDNLQDVAVDNNLFSDREIGHEMQSLWSEALISFNEVVHHIKSYHPKSDKNHKEHNKDIKNNKHGAPVASNKVNEGMKIKKNGKIIRLTESDLKRILKRVLNEQMEELGDNQDMGYRLDDSGHRVVVTSNNGFDAIEDKEAIEVITGTGRVNIIPNLSEFPNVFVLNLLNSEPITDIDVNSILNHPILPRVLFNYVDSPIMNSKVNELLNSEEANGGLKMIEANKVEREPRG